MWRIRTRRYSCFPRRACGCVHWALPVDQWLSRWWPHESAVWGAQHVQRLIASNSSHRRGKEIVKKLGSAFNGDVSVLCYRLQMSIIVYQAIANDFSRSLGPPFAVVYLVYSSSKMRPGSILLSSCISAQFTWWKMSTWNDEQTVTAASINVSSVVSCVVLKYLLHVIEHYLQTLTVRLSNENSWNACCNITPFTKHRALVIWNLLFFSKNNTKSLNESCQCQWSALADARCV